MRRKLFTLAAAMSAVLFVAVCVPWVRSYWRADEWGWERVDANDATIDYDFIGGSRDARCAVSNRGQVWLGRATYTWSAYPNSFSRWYHCPAEPYDPRLEGPSFQPSADVFNPDSGLDRYDGFIIPYWALALTTLLPASSAAGRMVRRAVALGRSRSGKCNWCGYDLRATPDRCPECGDVPAARRDPLPQRTGN